MTVAGSDGTRPMPTPTYGLPGYPSDKDMAMMLARTPNHKRRMADGCRRATESDSRR